MPDREDEGGEAPCFAHLFEDDENPVPDQVIAVTVSDGGVTPAE
jgi:hypothetical protein